jgi:hypothetical protein
MRSAIREDCLDDARRNVPTLISLVLTDDQARIVTEFVQALIVPNSFFSEETTDLPVSKPANLSLRLPGPTCKVKRSSSAAGRHLGRHGSAVAVWPGLPL